MAEPWVRAFAGTGDASISVDHKHGDRDRVTVKLAVRVPRDDLSSELSCDMSAEEAFAVASALIECAHIAEADFDDQLAHLIAGRPRA